MGRNGKTCRAPPFFAHIKMTNFANWSNHERQLWLDIADQAMRRWRLTPLSIRRLGLGSNIVFMVTTRAAKYVLRLQQARDGKAAQLRSELQWLAAIRRNTNLLAPLPVLALADGHEQLYLGLRHDMLPPPSLVYAVLFEYISGGIKSARELIARDVYRIGEYLGRLHSDAQFDAPADFDRPRLDWEGLFGYDSPYATPRQRSNTSAAQRAILENVAQHLRAPLTKLACKPGSTGLIHADLLAKNIVFRADAIAALDFEFCGWGFYLYDLAPLLWHLKGERASDYHVLEDALWRGYTSVRPTSDGDRELLEPLIAARQLASIRWLLANLRNPTVGEAAPPLIAGRCEELKVFLETGILRRSTLTL